MQDDNATLVTISDGGALRAVLKIVDDRKIVAVYDRDGILIPASKIPNWVWMQIRQRGLLYARDDALDDVVTIGMRQQGAPPGAGRFSRRQKILFASLPLAAIAIYAIVALVNALSTPSCSSEFAGDVRDGMHLGAIESGGSPEDAEYVANAFCVAEAAPPGHVYDSVYAYMIEGEYPAEIADFFASFFVGILSALDGEAMPTVNDVSEAGYNTAIKSLTRACPSLGTSPSYQSLFRNIDRHQGCRVSWDRAEVVQVVGDHPNYELRIAITVTESEWLGEWFSDPIYVYYYKAPARVLEGDVIKFSGHVAGTVTYGSTFGQSITIPAVTAHSIQRRR